MSNVVVRKSSISGQGLFAKEKISKGETIVSIKNPYVKSPTQSLDERYPSDAVIWMGFTKTCNILCDKEWTDPDTPPLWYFQNHSDNPNSKMIFFTTSDNIKSVKWVAKKDIQKDEEITFHYQPGKRLVWD